MVGWSSVRAAGSLQPGHYSSLISLHMKCLPHQVPELSHLQIRTCFHAHHHHSVTAAIDVMVSA